MARKAFGGIEISFVGVQDVTLGEVFGREQLSPADMIKKLWAFIKKAQLRVQ